MTAANLLLVAVIVVGLAWSRGVRRAAALEFIGNESKMVLYALLSSVTFTILILVNAGLGISGLLGKFEQTPPLIFPYFVGLFAIAFAIAFSPLGTLLAKKLSYSQLIGFHSFRVLAEAVIFLGVKEGIAPKQLSFEGYNFDIVTAISAIALSLYLRKKYVPKLILAWNCFGVTALIVIAFIAMTSMPTPLRLFMSEPTNAWVTRFPYIFLPGILVLAAWCGHIIIFRKLKAEWKLS